MKILYRIISMILVLSFIAASLVACGDKGKENGEGSASLGDQPTMKGTNVYGEPSFTTAKVRESRCLSATILQTRESGISSLPRMSLTRL